MVLNRIEVEFNPTAHTYTYKGVSLQGITGMLGRQLFPDKYKSVPDYILKKAADKGHDIHQSCEMVDVTGIDDGSVEVNNYLKLCKDNELVHEESEYIVSDLNHFASCIDKVYKGKNGEYHLADIKTTYKLDEEYVSWQLSVYAYLFKLVNPNAKIGKLYAIYLRGEESKLVEVPLIPEGVIIDLLTCEVEGIQFINPYKQVVTGCTLPDKWKAMEESIKNIDAQCAYWTQQRKELMEGVQKEMVLAGVYSWEGDTISFTRKKESIRKSFDTRRFQKDYPQLYKEYITETPIKGSLLLNTI